MSAASHEHQSGFVSVGAAVRAINKERQYTQGWRARMAGKPLDRQAHVMWQQGWRHADYRVRCAGGCGGYGW